MPLHGIGTRSDLPLPFSFVVLGAALALVVSFVVLFFAWRRPRYAKLAGRPLPALTAIVDLPLFRLAARLLVLGLYLWVGLAAVAGRDLLTNPSFGFVFVWMWVGLVPLSLLLGPFWRYTNPLRTIHRGLCAVAGTDVGTGVATLPQRLGVWPAAVTLFGFVWLELIQPNRTTLPVLRLWAVAWVVVVLVGAVAFGARWIEAADPFEAYANVLAQISPLRRVGGDISLVNPMVGLNSWSPQPGTAAVVAVLLGSTAFDSFTNTSWWISTVQGSDVSSLVWGTGGLLVMIAMVMTSFALATRWMARSAAAPGIRPADYPRRMAGSLVPIAVGYAVAHYATLLVIEGQRTAINLSDPLGRGWNVFGSAEMGVNASIYSYPAAIALVQLGAIVAGHVVGIVAAHEKALSLLRRDATLTGQWPLLVVMVGYTCAGLVLLFSP